MAERRWTVRRVAAVAATWLVSLFLAFVFMRAGVDKFSDDSGWARAFVVWGFPAWFRVLIGALEVAAALLLLVPRAAPVGAILIIVIMLGGMGTHIVHDQARHVRSEVLPIILATAILYARRDALAALLRRRPGTLDPSLGRG
jgi:putative oxidoreductase